MTLSFSVSSLTGGYSGSDVVFNMSFAVTGGEVLGIFGRNGVGKSTLARLITGLLAPTSGDMVLNGQSIGKRAAFERCRLGLGYMPQTRMVFDDLTVRENLSLGSTARATDPYFEMFPRLAERLDQQAGTMSGGERKILSFVRTMVEDSSLIVLDEPSEGVQPENIKRMSDILKQRAADGATIILIEQNLKFLCQTATLFIGMETGRAVLNLREPNLYEMRKILTV